MIVKAKVDIKTLEFMLDLPQSFVIKDISTTEETAVLTVETDDQSIPEQFSLVYESDEYGNVVLTRFGEIAND